MSPEMSPIPLSRVNATLLCSSSVLVENNAGKMVKAVGGLPSVAPSHRSTLTQFGKGSLWRRPQARNDPTSCRPFHQNFRSLFDFDGGAPMSSNISDAQVVAMARLVV